MRTQTHIQVTADTRRVDPENASAPAHQPQTPTSQSGVPPVRQPYSQAGSLPANSSTQSRYTYRYILYVYIRT